MSSTGTSEDTLVLTEEELNAEIGFDAAQLDELSDTVEDVEITRSSCLDIWVLKACFEYARGEITARLYILDTFVGGGRISRERPRLCLGGGIGLAKFKVCANADFERDELFFNGSVCVRKWFGGWKCRSFRSIALTW